MQTSSCPEQKREPCYFMFFRINVAIVVRTDFSSVFINQTSLSFEFKRLKLGQLFAISLSRTRRFRSFSSLLQWNRKWYSSSTSPEEQWSHFLSCRRVPWYLPVLIFNWWQEIRSSSAPNFLEQTIYIYICDHKLAQWKKNWINLNNCPDYLHRVNFTIKTQYQECYCVLSTKLTY